MDYDLDASTAEFMLQHLPLEDVLSFILDREAVRAIPDGPRGDMSKTPTLPAAGESFTGDHVPFELVRKCVRPEAT